MKHKVDELEGELLDAAAAKADGWRKCEEDPHAWWAPNGSTFGPVASIERGGIKGGYGYHPAHNWAHGGPILDRWEEVEFVRLPSDGLTRCRLGRVGVHSGANTKTGRTKLEAAMRAHVASRFGEEVDLP